MKILKSTTGTTYQHATREDADTCIRELADWCRIHGVHTAHNVSLYDIADDVEDIDSEIANSEPIATVSGFTHDNMIERDEELTEDADADITTIISDNAIDALEQDYDGRFAEFLSNFPE